MQLRLGTNYNFGLESTIICERGFSKWDRVKSDRRSQLKLETLDASMRVSLHGPPMEIMDWLEFSTLENQQKPGGGFAFGVG